MNESEFKKLLEIEMLDICEVQKLPLAKRNYYQELAKTLTLEERKKIFEQTKYKPQFFCSRCGKSIHCMNVRFGENFCRECFNELSMKGGSAK